MATIYNDASTGSAIGRVTDDGIIYNNASTGNAIGRVTQDGIIYNGASTGNAIGRVTDDGIIYNDASIGSAIGRVTQDGIIYNDASTGSAIGRVTDGGRLAGGAAFFLLTGVLGKNQPSPRPASASSGSGAGKEPRLHIIPLLHWKGWYIVGAVLGLVLGIAYIADTGFEASKLIVLLFIIALFGLGLPALLRYIDFRLWYKING